MSKKLTKAQERRWDAMRELRCIICGCWQVEIHHCETGAGGRKDHDKVIPLCVDHHRGGEGIHHLGRKLWQKLHGTEHELMNLVKRRLRET